MRTKGQANKNLNQNFYGLYIPIIIFKITIRSITVINSVSNTFHIIKKLCICKYFYIRFLPFKMCEICEGIINNTISTSHSIRDIYNY